MQEKKLKSFMIFFMKNREREIYNTKRCNYFIIIKSCKIYFNYFKLPDVFFKMTL